MKKIFPLVLLACHLNTIAQTGIANEYFLKRGGFEEKIANLGPGCRIKVQAPKWKRLSQRYQDSEYRGMAGFSIPMPPKSTNGGEWGIDFNCFRTNEEAFQESWANRYPPPDAKREKRSEREVFIDNEGNTFTPIKAIDAKGWAITFDDTTGDERFRTRHLRYCIKNEKNAICGSSDIGYIEYLKKRKNIDILGVTLNILESIEFLEDTPPNGIRAGQQPES